MRTKELFNIGPYRFMFGPSDRAGATPFAPLIHGFSLWMWNGHFWQLEIEAATDVDGARHAMQFKLAERKAAMR